MKKRLIALFVLVMMVAAPSAEAFSFKKALKSAKKKVKSAVKKVKKKAKSKKSSYIYDASGNKICFVVDDVKSA